MARRYCDDCYRRLPEALPEFDAQPGKFCAEFKNDGWRTHLEFTAGGILTWSRRWKKQPVSAEMQALIDRLDFPVGTILDGEWLSRRTDGPEALFLWDAMRYGEEWVGNKPYRERMALLSNVPSIWGDVKPEEFEQQEGPLLSVVERFYTDFATLFERAKTLPWTEGLVVKMLDSKLVGSTRDRAPNPQWFKVKFRDGSAGDTIVA